MVVRLSLKLGLWGLDCGSWMTSTCGVVVTPLWWQSPCSENQDVHLVHLTYKSSLD